MDDRDEDQRQRDQGIVAPGKPPQFPAHIDAGEHDKEDVAEAAWHHAAGNIHAFERLCREHVGGLINLFEDGFQGHYGQRMPATADSRALRQAAAGGPVLPGNNPLVPPSTAVQQSGAVQEPGTISGTGTIENAGTMEHAGTVAAEGSVHNVGTVGTAGTVGTVGTAETVAQAGTVQQPGMVAQQGTGETG
jgi:hypothetical protein